VSFGKHGTPEPDEVDVSSDYSYRSLSEGDMAAAVNSFRTGFKSALRDLQRFHIFLLTVNQKLDGLLKIFFNLTDKSSNESDTEDACPLDSPMWSVDTHIDSNGADIPRHQRRPSRSQSHESLDLSLPGCRESFFTINFKGNGDGSRGLWLTM
jgi:atypical dual specificity phosphatase